MHDSTALPGAADGPIRFGRVPIAATRRHLPRMTGADAKVTLALACYADRGFACRPAVQTLAADTGLDRRTVQRCLNRMAAIGFLELDRGGGRAHANALRMIVGPPENSGTSAALSGGETAASEPPIAATKGGITVPKGRHGAPERAAPVPPEQIGTDLNSSRAAADRAIGSEPEPTEPDPAIAANLAALAAAGVGEPKRGELARRPGVTAAIVQRVAEQARANDKGTGWLILRLEDLAAAAVATAERAKRHDAEVERQRRARAAERANAPPPLTLAQKAAIRERMQRRGVALRPAGSTVAATDPATAGSVTP